MSSATLVSSGEPAGSVGPAQAVNGETTKRHSSVHHSSGRLGQYRSCRLGPGNTNIHLIQLAIKGVGKQAFVAQAVVVGHLLRLLGGEDFFLHR